MTYPDFEARWKPAGGAERANYSLFLQDLCDLIGVARPDPTTDNPAQDAYVLERAVEFNDHGKRSIGRIDLYKRGCFVLETKQGTDTPDQQKTAERAELGLPTEKRRKGHAVRGTAKWVQMMQTARQQALGYVRALPADESRPLFVLIADVGYCIDLYSNFAGVGDQFVPFPDQTRYRLPLSKLAEDETRDMLRLIFVDPRELDPSRRAARVTRELAEYLAKLSTQLERTGHSPDLVAQFLMRCLFTMFSEDVGLIPKESFTGMLRQYAQPDLREFLPDALQTLWRTMDTGGFSPDLKARLRKFNGKLFHDARAFTLSADQIALLLKAAEADWTAVEPAIFGTLLERALDPRERHSLGAHYTPRRYVERLVLPTVLEPLRREWAAAQAAAARLLEEGKDKVARAELERFLRRLTSIKILDPACGSGNFLYVTLEHLKRLEGEVLAAINSYGVTALLNLSGGTTISPRQLLGLELNPRAAAIADVVLKIGYLQWHLRTHGVSELPEPLLDEYENIHQQDAALQHDPPVPRIDANGQPVTRWDGITTKTHPVTGQPVPDETARVTVYDYPNPRPAEWPQADFIVGNPPFVGTARMRDALGDGYTEALRKTYKGKVPESADLVMYWWHNAAEQVKQGITEQFGFITTNSLKQTFNRRVMQPFLEGDKSALVLKFAIPDHPWVDSADGAAVRIAMTVGERRGNGATNGNLLTVKSESDQIGDDAAEVSFVVQQGTILPDLTIGAELDSARPIKANQGLSNPGVKLHGAGFIVTSEKAKNLGLGEIIGLERHIRPYRNGKDLTDKPRYALVIDLFGLTAKQTFEKYPAVYQHVLETVKPERDLNNRASRRDNWWLFGETNPKLRTMLKDIPRYIVTVETAKHRTFQFLNNEMLPDNMLTAIALEDAYHLGVLSSKLHVTWALAAGGTLEDRPRYNKTRCFDPFPFPDATPQQQSCIRELAEQLDAHRKRQQAAHPTLTLTDLYNVVEKLRAGEGLNAKEQTINQQGLASVVLSLHQQIDAAVADAYGWPHDLLNSEILTRLVRLNHERAAEEATGKIRYLRPSYQAPGQQQLGIDLPTSIPTTSAPVAVVSQQNWPKELAQQMQAVRDAIQQAGVPLSTKQVAAFFARTRPEKVQPLLDTLAALALLRQTAEGTYAM
ncbi:class I SAM-dependent DNA methyltransferase [Spirosoma areae]